MPRSFWRSTIDLHSNIVQFLAEGVPTYAVLVFSQRFLPVAPYPGRPPLLFLFFGNSSLPSSFPCSSSSSDLFMSELDGQFTILSCSQCF